MCWKVPMVERTTDDQTSADDADDAPQPEGTGIRTAVLIVLVALVLFFLFGRR